MAIFSDTPIEIINHILGFIEKADLLSLCLVNKFLHHSVEPLLYSVIKITWENQFTPPIIPLLHTLIRRTELFNYIDSVCLEGDEFDDDLDRPSLDPITIPLDQFINAINKTKVPYISLWINRLRSGGMDAFAGLLIAHLSKTTSLDITHNFINGDDILGKVLLSKVINQLPPFERLRRIGYVKRKDRQVWQRNQIFPHTISLFYLPATIKSIRVSVSNPEIFQWPTLEPDLDHITSLDLQWLNGAHIEKILALTRNLTYLRWRWIYYDHPDEEELETTTLDFDQVISALSPAKGTLERFIFSMHIGDSDYDRLPVEMTLLGTFRGLLEFKRITFLVIPMVFLADFGSEPLPLEQSIPTSIRSLYLPWLDENFGEVKAQWLENQSYYEQEDSVARMIRSLAYARPELRTVWALDWSWTRALWRLTSMGRRRRRNS